MSAGDPESFRQDISEDLDVFDARRGAARIARSIGFSSVEAGEVAIIVSELATNIVKHGNRGSITVDIAEDSGRPGVRITADDHGPPIEPFATALLDGHTNQGRLDPLALWKRRGIGAGLGAISRFADRLEYARFGSGNRLVVIRFRRSTRRGE